MTEANASLIANLADAALPNGTVLSDDQFTITGLLAAGGFGITYRAEDNVLGRTVVIKECFPADICARHGLNVVARSRAFVEPMSDTVGKFMREARSLAKLRHPNIVGVHRAFEENKTAYMALDLIEGRDLFDIIKTSKLPPGRVENILLQLLDAIEKVHEIDLLHRDISPDNIVIEKKSGAPVLIDFGAARAASSQHTRAISSFTVVKDGYSPQEFYVDGSEHSPGSDLYALAATFYHVISGRAPANSQTRMLEVAGRKPDPCVPLEGRIDGYDPEFLRAIDTAMQVHPSDRLQSAAKWRSMIPNSLLTARNENQVTGGNIPLDLELSLSQLVEETNDEVRKSKLLPVEPAPVAEIPEPPSKLEWIVEFNQESLRSPPRPKPVEDELVDSEVIRPAEETAQVWSDPRRAYISQKRVFSEIDWIDRAAVKQERIRTERMSHFELSVPGTRHNGLTVSQVPWEVSDEASRPRIQPISLIVAILVCFGLLTLLNVIDRQQTQQQVAKPEAGRFEMSGSIIR